MSALGEKIAAAIRAAGGISFARFMDWALYCPVYGYYEKEADSPGRRGDFYTSVSVGSLYGELLAFQFSRWLAGRPARAVQLVEAGAHRGDLAHDILTWLRARRPALFESVEYWIIEPSARRRGWQAQRLAPWGAKVQWAGDFATLEARRGRVEGVVFSNELLDAFPVHRLGWDAQQRAWFEWGVGLQNDHLVWIKGTSGFDGEAAPAALAPALPGELTAVLPDGFTVEVCPTAVAWWQSAAAILTQGKLITVDYGLTAEERLSPERLEGTLRAYCRHQVSREVLAQPGEQDLTAHVDFSAVEAAGAAAGLQTEALQTQGQFLTAIAARAWEPGAEFGEWTRAQTRQFQTLTHPEHLGRAFRVLVQSR